MRSTTRRLLVLPVAATVAWGLAACTGESTDDASGAATAGAGASAGAPAEGGAFELTQASFAELVAKQSEAGSYHVTMSTQAGGQELTGEGDVAVAEGGDTEMTMTMEVPGVEGGMELRLVDGTMYVSMGELTQGQFIAVDPDDPDDPLAAQLGTSADEMSATESLESLEAAVVSVEKSGEPETLDGVETQPYDVVVDPTKVTGSAKERLDAATASGVTLPSQLTYVFYVGDDGLPRRMTVDLMDTTTQLDLTDWGKAVSVEAPAADEIVELPGS